MAHWKSSDGDIAMLEAAEPVRDPDFVPALEKLRERMGRDLPARFFDSVDKALQACSKKA
jgi:hypothetical protein